MDRLKSPFEYYDKLKDFSMIEKENSNDCVSLTVKAWLYKDVIHPQEHFIDDWSNLIDTEELADKLDAYEDVREGTKMRPSPANEGMTPRSDSRNSANCEFAPRMNR
ncbi:hypothetical protein TNCV_2919401 [Trichonephila clavipes]|nr:hypothetical protein TNCV_2919401 [Trichonephila clavipes]